MAARTGSLLRYIVRQMGVAAYMDLLWITKDLKQFLFYFGSETLLSVAAMSTTLLLAARFNGIGSWSTDQVLFMLAYSTAVMGAARRTLETSHAASASAIRDAGTCS